MKNRHDRNVRDGRVEIEKRCSRTKSNFMFRCALKIADLRPHNVSQCELMDCLFLLLLRETLKVVHSFCENSLAQKTNKKQTNIRSQDMALPDILRIYLYF